MSLVKLGWTTSSKYSFEWNILTAICSSWIYKETLQDLQNAAQSKSHRLSRHQVILTKRLFLSFEIEYCQSLSFWVWSELKLLGFVTIWVLEFCHNLIFLDFSQFEFWEFCHNLSILTIWVVEFVAILFFEFCRYVSFVTIWGFWDLSQFQFLSCVAIWVFKFCHNSSFEFCHNLSFWFFSQFQFLSFVKKK